MANAYKILGQVADASANDVELYLVPASTEAVVSTIVVCNREAANNTFRIATKTDNSIPEEILKSRAEYFRKITQDRTDAIDRDLMKEQHPDMPINIDRQSRVTFGGSRKK